MSSEQIAVPYRRVPPTVVGALLVATFAIGALTGFIVPRVLDAGSGAARASGTTQTFDSARNADPAVVRPAFKGVSDNNMSDAVRTSRLRATDASGSGSFDHHYGQLSRLVPFKGVADNNMSDATYAAQHGSH